MNNNRQMIVTSTSRERATAMQMVLGTLHPNVDLEVSPSESGSFQVVAVAPNDEQRLSEQRIQEMRTQMSGASFALDFASALTLPWDLGPIGLIDPLKK